MKPKRNNNSSDSSPKSGSRVKTPMTAMELRAHPRYRALLNDLLRALPTKSEVARKMGLHAVEIGPILDETRGVSLRLICTASENLGLHYDYFLAEADQDIPPWREYLLDVYKPESRSPSESESKRTDSYQKFLATGVAKAVSEATLEALMLVDTRQPMSVDGYATLALTMEMSARSKVDVLGPEEPEGDEEAQAALDAFLATTRGQSAQPQEIEYMRQHRWPEGYQPDAACYQSLWESLRWGKWSA